MSKIEQEIKSIQKRIIEAKEKNEPYLVIQKLQQKLDKLSGEKKHGTL